MKNKENLSPTVKGNVRYIESLKRNYLKDELLGKILNLKMKKKIGVHFIEQDNIIKNSPERGIHMLAESQRWSNKLSQDRVSNDEESKDGMFELNEEGQKTSEERSDSSKSSSSYDLDNYNASRINLPGVLIKKLDSEENQSSEADEEFKRDTTPKQKLKISPINKNYSFLKVSPKNLAFMDHNSGRKYQFYVTITSYRW